MKRSDVVRMMQQFGVPVGSDDPEATALGAPPLHQMTDAAEAGARIRELEAALTALAPDHPALRDDTPDCGPGVSRITLDPTGRGVFIPGGTVIADGGLLVEPPAGPGGVPGATDPC